MLSDSDIRERLGPLADPASDPSQPQPPSRRRAIAVPALLAVLLWIGGVAILLHFEKTAPHKPNPATDHVARIPGRPSVYVTPDQRYAAGAALAIPLLSTLGVALFAIPRRPPEQ